MPPSRNHWPEILLLAGLAVALFGAIYLVTSNLLSAG